MTEHGIRRVMLATFGFAACLLAASAPCAAATDTVIYAFNGRTNGGIATSPLIRVGGKFYGTTYGGGSGDNGTVFFVKADGRHVVQYRFGGGTDGSHPYGGLLEFGSVFYGTTETGGGTGCGGDGCGTLYSLTPQGVYTQIFAFQDDANGAYPSGTLVALGGLLYGTATSGGANDAGTVFSITPQGALKTLYAFHGDSDGSDPLNLVTDGTSLYGTTGYGAGTGCQSNGCGTVFTIDSQGDEKTLYAFETGKNGGSPYGRLLKLGNSLYGTTYGGGSKDNGASFGTVFSVSLDGVHHLLHAFNRNDGGLPYAGLIDLGGVLYGTTSSFGSAGHGTIFAITKQGNLTTLYNFQGGEDGDGPVATLLAHRGTLYGTTSYGGGKGEDRDCGPSYCGTVFAFTP